ncbi:MAG TPA: antibiotic biosynthesis monooxygenase [Thermomicrobiales bacterium]|nr:antibiotic biosynthesis monooxygenase [Thermomicrobiales bacterium]
MYGTIAKLRIKPGMEAELERLSREQVPEIPGFQFQYVFRMDADPEEVYLVVGFESEDAYRQNAESPAQHARYEAYRSLLASEPEWHDGEVVFSVQP